MGGNIHMSTACQVRVYRLWRGIATRHCMPERHCGRCRAANPHRVARRDVWSTLLDYYSTADTHVC